ncbi:MAG TPA: CHAT domain-containing tetratricopeptide repeat protein [Blastocatellia bacterium]|nr:CHAT domain-containing tetratricopeptide repeat protein [Blastocatellia bacterium]
MSDGQSPAYRIRLESDQFLKVVVEQEGIDVIVRISEPGGRQLLEVDSESRLRGPESVTLVAGMTGEYRLVVQPRLKGAPAGSYGVRIEELRAATENDRILDRARGLAEESARLQRAGKYDEAYPRAEQALKMNEQVLGPDHVRVAATLKNLADLYWHKGDYERAWPLYRRAQAIWEKALGTEHPLVAYSLHSLALIEYERGDYVSAERLFQRTIKLLEQVLGPDHPQIANALNSLGTLYLKRGDYLKAEQLFRRSLAMREKALGPEHPEVSSSLNNLAILYRDRRDFDQAEPLFQRSLAILEKAFGPEHPDLARGLNNLAILYGRKKDYAKAGPLFQRGLEIWEKALGPEHPAVSSAVNNLAEFYRKTGDYAQAETLFRRALAVRERALGAQHPSTALALNSLATLHATKGEFAQALALQARAGAAEERNLVLNLTLGSERQKLAYLDLLSRGTAFTLSLHHRGAPNDPLALDLAFTTLLRRKGRGLDTMINTIEVLRRHTAPQDLALLDRLAGARARLAELVLRESGAVKPETYRRQLQSLEEEVEQLEAQLSSRSASFRAQVQPVTTASVQAAIPADSALVEFAVYTPQDLGTDQPSPPRYVAYLLPALGQPRWVDLGDAAAIDLSLDAWREALRSPNRPDVKSLARVVDEKVMRPVRAALPQEADPVRRLLIAPDGLLNLIPFAALVDEEDRYLVERYSISYLSSGRDLLRLQVRQPGNEDVIVVADPDYGEMAPRVQSEGRDVGPPSGAPQTAGSNLNLAQIYFPPLRGTVGEAKALKNILPQATVYTREQATETALKRLSSPGILHIATHGFFLNKESGSSGTRLGAAVAPADLPRENPLLRSGLALAGANLRGARADQGDDGVLTALEAAGLDLSGTKLVVLSACDTGLGDVRNGEGIYGLRRALALAGSETQVVSLWPVSDLGTRELMIGYYKALQQGAGRGEGLRQVQLEMLKHNNRRHPFYWAGFIQSGEWANLEGKR